MQTALAADFRLMVHNFGLKIESVFGRESVPNLDADYARIDAKLLQAWGIGEALISGGSGGPYASSALNREFVTQMMVGFQNALRRHITKRAEVIAEAQGHFDYDLKGGQRIPIYREIVVDEGTEDERIVKVPKLLVPEVKFSTLNLRDEAQERAFISQLKAMGVPVSDKTLAVNIPMEFEQELERTSDEAVAKLMATAQAMKKVQALCDAQNLPYPPELSQHLMSTLQLRQGKDQTDQLDAQTPVTEAQSALQLEQIELQKMQLDQQAAAMMGMGPQPPQGAPPRAEQGGAPPEQGGAPPEEGGAPPGGGQQMAASRRKAMLMANPPSGLAPGGKPPNAGAGPELAQGVPNPLEGTQAVSEPQRNRAGPVEIATSPAISHEQRKNAPTASRRKRTRKGEEDNVVDMPRKKSRFETGPSSWGASKRLTEEQVRDQVARREAIAAHRPGRTPRVADLVKDPNFYRATNSQHYSGQIQADWPEIQAGGATDSKKILEGMVEQYQEIYGVEPRW
jgi:hypothetical protein